MKEIVERLQEKRQVELAKMVLESAGYEVNKQVNESRKLSFSKFWKSYNSTGPYPGREKIKAVDAILDILSKVETYEPGAFADDYPHIKAAWRNLTDEELEKITQIWNEAYED